VLCGARTFLSRRVAGRGRLIHLEDNYGIAHPVAGVK